MVRFGTSLGTSPQGRAGGAVGSTAVAVRVRGD